MELTATTVMLVGYYLGQRVTCYGRVARLRWPEWLVKYQDGKNATPTRKRLSIPILTWSDVRITDRDRRATTMPNGSPENTGPENDRPNSRGGK